MLRLGHLALPLLLACAPHEREDGTLVDAPAVDPMPDAPLSGPTVAERTASAPDPGCDVALADVPTPLFGERLLIRMPRNVEMLEENPTFASAQASGGFVVTCDAVLRRAGVMVFQNDDAKSLGDYAREVTELLEKNGYVGARDIEWTAPRTNGRRGTVVIPALHGQPETELLLDIRRFRDLLVLVMFDALPEDFARLSPSLHASADSLLAVPQ